MSPRRVGALLLAVLLWLPGLPAWAGRAEEAVRPGEPSAEAFTSAELPEDAFTAVWREGGRTRRAYLAADELVAARPAGLAGQETVRRADPSGRFAPLGRQDRGLIALRSYVARPNAEEVRALVRQSAAQATVGQPRLLPAFYASRTRQPAARLVLLGELAIRYAAAASAERIEALERAHRLTRLRELPDGAVLYAAPGRDPFAALDVAAALADEPTVTTCQPHWLRPRVKRLVPNDPLFSGQWTMLGQTANGAALSEAWDLTLASARTLISIVDDGLETDHEDLKDNIQAALCLGFSVEGGVTVATSDPTPASTDYHGSSCAGVAAARGLNSLGTCGAAPLAGLAGERILFELDDVQAQAVDSDALEAAALGWQPQAIAIYSNSWGPVDTGTRLERPGPLTEAVLAGAVKSGRGGLGSIYVWAAGNGGLAGDNSNYDGYANSPWVIAVAACTDEGRQAYYSEPGANVLVCAPSSGGLRAVATTDLTGAAGLNVGLAVTPGLPQADYPNANYTMNFGGTSAATPLTAGTVALMLDANPRLGWRDVQRVLATTAYRLNPEDGDWSQNGAGLWVNHKYGFGRVDAARAVRAARTWRRLPPETVIETPVVSPGAVIPDGAHGGAQSVVTVDQDLEVERAEVEFSSDHPYWGELRVVLTSPAGTRSVLAEPHRSGPSDLASASGHYAGWRFTSVRHLGESARGVWTLSVSDEAAANVGTFLSWKLRLRGVRRGPPAALPLLLGQP